MIATLNVLHPPNSDAISKLYNEVDELKTPLPRKLIWKQDCNSPTFIGFTKYPIPKKCGIFYFEVQIVDAEGYLTVGLLYPERPLFSLLHKNGTNSLEVGNSNGLNEIGETGDVIGCGLNFVTKTSFYTHNGHFIRNVCDSIHINAYLYVRMTEAKTMQLINFGEKPFAFQDIYKMKNDQRMVLISKFNAPDGIFSQHAEKSQLKMALKYAVINAYEATAKCLGTLIDNPFEQDTFIDKRRACMDLITAGKIKEVILLVQQIWPNFWKENDRIYFRIKCRQFVEYVYEQRQDHCSDSKSQRMTTFDGMQDLMMIGKEASAILEKMIKDQKHTKDDIKLLNDTEGLITYTNPCESSLKWLFSLKERQACARVFNMHVLKYLNLPLTSPMEDLLYNGEIVHNKLEGKGVEPHNFLKYSSLFDG